VAGALGERKKKTKGLESEKVEEGN